MILFLGSTLGMENTSTLSARLKELSTPKFPLPELCETYDALSLFKDGQFNTAFPSCPEFGKCDKDDFFFGPKIGRGRYGEVVKGMHFPTGKTVAIKKFSGDNLNTANIRREECSQHMVDHPTIRKHYCTISDLEEKKIYLVMEYIDGQPLSEVIKEKPEISLESIRRWTASLAVAVHAIHLQGLTYCDLKMENIMLTKDGKIKLIDFGLCKKSFSCIPGMAYPSGTALMWPPEYLPQDSTKCYSNPSADWWAFAVTLFMLWVKSNEGPYDIESLNPYKPKGRQDKEGFALYMSKFGELLQKGFPISEKYLKESPQFADFISMMTEPDPMIRIGDFEDRILEILFAHPWLQPLDLKNNPPF